MFEFTLFRIPVRVEPWHWLILALIGSLNVGLENRDDFINLILFVAAGFFSILVHELGHALTGRKFGARDVQVVLHGMGGVAIFPQANFSRKGQFFMTAAGPGFQIILGLIAFAIFHQVAESAGARMFFYLLFIISIFWAVINCIPVWPLDGGQMLAAALGPNKVVLTHQISIGAGVIGGLLGLFYTGMIVFPILLGYFAYQNWQMLQQYQNR